MDARCSALCLAGSLLACSSSSSARGGGGDGSDGGTGDSAADAVAILDSSSADAASDVAPDSLADSASDAGSDSAASACATVAGWQVHPIASCLLCISQASGALEAGAAPCASQASAYTESCGTCKTQCAGSPINLCACEASCDTASCQALFGTMMSCVQTWCTSYCP